MNTMKSTIRPGRRSLTGVAAVTLAVTALLGAPTATATQGLGDGGAVRCDLGLWYVVHNPSISKPRGHQDGPDNRTPPTGACPTSRPATPGSAPSLH